MSRQNTSLVLAERPAPRIIPGQTFRVETAPAPTADDLKDGQLLVETLYISLDPAMRGWISDRMRSYVPPVPIGAVMRSSAVCRVLASRSPKAAAGDVVVAFPGWTEVAIVDDATVQNLWQTLQTTLPPDAVAQLRLTDLLGPLGMTGCTAYFGLAKVAGPIRPTDTVVVSGAAGATGSVVAQIARLQGAKRVVGIAGSADKVRWLRDELHLDVALNYNDADFAKQFQAATPDYIDVYWDNVGGAILDLALARANTYARFVMCGAISQYNAAEVQGPKNLTMVIAQRIKMQGFIVTDYLAEAKEAVQELAQWVIAGKIKRTETILKGGVQDADKALLGLFEGKNTGKLILEVKNPNARL